MHSRPSAVWKLAALWVAAIAVILLAVFDAFPGRAATKPVVHASPTSSAAATASGSLNASASARRAAGRARASASATAVGTTRGDKLLAALNAATLSADTAVAAVGAIDVTTGQEVSWQSATFGGDVPAYTASIVKLDIAEAYLLHKADVGEQLDDGEQLLMQYMLVDSDNNSAQTLYDDMGEDMLGALNKRLGLTDTVLTDDGTWGLTETSVADQLQLLSNLTATGPLSANARQYILGLMRGVEADQAWGAGTVGSNAAVKNGWLPLDDGAGWIINTVGLVTAPNGHQIQLVVLSTGWETEEEGIDAVNDLVANLITSLAG